MEALVAYISAIMTLEPGDVISTGTPSGIGGMTLIEAGVATLLEKGPMRVSPFTAIRRAWKVSVAGWVRRGG